MGFWYNISTLSCIGFIVKKNRCECKKSDTNKPTISYWVVSLATGFDILQIENYRFTCN